VSLPPSELAFSTTARAFDLVRQNPWLTATAFVGVVGVAIWIYVGVRAALVEATANNLRALIDAEVVALETWVREKQLNVSRWARDERVIAAAGELLAGADTQAAAARVCRGPARDRLVAAIDALLGGELAPGVNLIGHDGLLLSTRVDAYCGARINEPTRRALERVFAGGISFTAPVAEADRLAGVHAAVAVPQRPLVWFAAPVRDARGRVVAALTIGKHADERFSKVFATAQLGDTGEAYAFDANGRMLSVSRFRAVLEDAGRLRAGQSEILNLLLRDPESALAGDAGDAAGANADDALTRIVRTAIEARNRLDKSFNAGEITEPYSNYLGQAVVGAWRWLPEYDIGVAVEQGVNEAFAPLDRLERVFVAILVAAGSALLFLLVALGGMLRMRRERDEARRVGNYELFEEIGQGGSARVYRARHRLLKRPTAVKIIQLQHATDELLARFDREVRLCSQLMHPNTIEIFDYGRTPEGLPYYAMELLDGLTLQQLVEREGALDAARTIHILRGIAGSLAEAHERGLVHRDVTPANIMVCRKGGLFDVPKLLDFGLIKDMRRPHTRDLTRALRVLGTPAYMAPERIERPDSADHRSDVYALGAVAYYALAGRAPFAAAAADSDLSLAYHVVHTPPAPLAQAAPKPLPEVLVALVMACLAKRPDERPQSAQQVAAALEAAGLEHPWPQSAARLWWDRQSGVRIQDSADRRAVTDGSAVTERTHPAAEPNPQS
jgi:serine/threonine-protein kinase